MTLRLLLCGALLSGCFTPVTEVECEVDGDCAPAFFCVERRCGTARPTADAGAGRVDAGLPPTPGDGGVDWGNVANELRGPPLGSARSPNADLTRSLTVTTTGDARIHAVSAQLTRDAVDSETGYVAVRVKNVGSSGACFFRSEETVYVDANGQAVHDDDLGFVDGSSATLEASGVTTDTCLLPGEEGFVTDIVLESSVRRFFSRTVDVRLAFSASSGGFKPTTRFIPAAYDTNGAFGVSMRAVNEGPSTISFEGRHLFAKLVPLDEAGRGLGWAFLDTPSQGVTRVGSGESLTMTTRFFVFSSSTTRTYARTGAFDVCRTCLRAPVDLSTHEGQAALLSQLRDAEREKLRALGE
jgi:hypothetical protein